jgi:hypothetical protein
MIGPQIKKLQILLLRDGSNAIKAEYMYNSNFIKMYLRIRKSSKDYLLKFTLGTVELPLDESCKDLTVKYSLVPFFKYCIT